MHDKPVYRVMAHRRAHVFGTEDPHYVDTNIGHAMMFGESLATLWPDAIVWLEVADWRTV